MTIPEPWALRRYGPTIIGALLLIALRKHPAVVVHSKQPLPLGSGK